MSRLDAFLDESVTANLLSKVGNNGSLTKDDIRQASVIQSLQMARIGEVFALDLIESERQCNVAFTTLVESVVKQ